MIVVIDASTVAERTEPIEIVRECGDPKDDKYLTPATLMPRHIPIAESDTRLGGRRRLRWQM